MKTNTFFLFITIAIGFVSAGISVQQGPGSEPTSPGNAIPSPGPGYLEEIANTLLKYPASVISTTPRPGQPDIEDRYVDGQIKNNKYGACVPLLTDSEVIKSATFSTLVVCEIFNDENCKGQKYAANVVLPANVPLSNPFNLGSFAAKSYICNTFGKKSPIDVKYDLSQLGVIGKN